VISNEEKDERNKCGKDTVYRSAVYQSGENAKNMGCEVHGASKGKYKRIE